MNIEQRLRAMSDEMYREFSSKLIPGCKPLLGVRLPMLRRLAKEIAEGDWRSDLSSAKDEFFEETMLQGMIIGCAKMPLEERFEWMKWFIPKIDNWSVCDSFCAGLKFVKEEREAVWQWINPYLCSKKEFERRFAVVLMLDFFVEPEYIDAVLKRVSSICLDDYYVKMGVAWLLSICYVKFPEDTMPYLLSISKDRETYQKALQKIIESRRITPEQRKAIRDLKQKK